jgi:hypothetical protein
MLPLVVVQPSVSCRFGILIFSAWSIKKATLCICGTDDLASNQQLMLNPKSAFMPSVFALFYVFNLIWCLLRNKEMRNKFVRQC